MTRRTIPERLRQLRAVAALACVLLLALPWSAWPQGRQRRAIAALAWRVLLAGFGIHLRVHGAAVQPGALLAANHISWIDIAALARLTDCGFVAKAEVGRWPIIGTLARRQGCLFVDRGRRSAIRATLGSMQGYRARANLTLFPEGTSGDGDRVLPFRSSLFAAVEGGFSCVQPVTLCYRRRDGSPLLTAERLRVAWVGEEALLPHALNLAASGGALLDLWFDEPVEGMDRKALAEACHARIAARLAQLQNGDQPAALKRAA